MNNKLRVMQIFDIQKDYLKHKERLISIRNTNSKQKLQKQSLKKKTNQSRFKKSHSFAQNFLSKQKTKKIQYQNDILLKNVNKVFARQFSLTIKNEDSKSSLRSTTSSKNSRLKNENKNFQNKIKNAKSQYEKFRKTQSKTMNAQSSKKEQLARILQRQFGIKPTVLFPRVKVNNKSKLNNKNNDDNIINENSSQGKSRQKIRNESYMSLKSKLMK